MDHHTATRRIPAGLLMPLVMVGGLLAGPMTIIGLVIWLAVTVLSQ